MLKDTELAWAAGFFDGEGHSSTATKCRNKYTRRFRVAITQTHRDVLDRFRDALGCLGVVRGPYGPYSGHSPFWTYATDAAADSIAVMTHLYPFLSKVKREQFDTAFGLYCSTRKAVE